MEDLLVSLVPTLASLVVLGLTILAYRHPAAYLKVYPFVTALFVAIFTGTIAWNEAVSNTVITIMRAVSPDCIGPAFDASQTIRLPSWLLGVAGGLTGYVIFLSRLYKLIGKPLNEPHASADDK